MRFAEDSRELYDLHGQPARVIIRIAVVVCQPATRVRVIAVGGDDIDCPFN